MTRGRRVAFGDFDLDLESAELRRSGQPVKLAPQPARVLSLLVEHHGETVSREELKRHIWGDGTFIDFDQGLNFCIRQIRQVLGEDADRPKFIETVPKRGYRFIAEVVPSKEHEAEASPEGRSGPAGTRPKQASRSSLLALLRLRLAVPALALIAGIAAIFVVWADADETAPHRKPMIAVLPFDNLSEDRSESYFSDGITEELTTQLARIDPARLGVIARRSADAYRDSEKTAGDVGRELGVQHLVEGTVRRSNGRVRISARLIRIADQTQIWADVFEADLSDILAVQQRIGREIARQVLARLTVVRSRPPRAVNPAAYDLYLRGRFYWNRRTGPEIQRAITSFREALALDPSFAMAHAGLGDCQMRTTGYADALESANAALALDENLAEAHVTRAHALMHQLRWAEAEPAFRRAIELDPSYPAARYFFAEYLIARGRRSEAMQEALHGIAVDPLGAITSHAAGVVLYYAGDYQRALPHLRRALEFDPTHHWTHGRIALVLERQKAYAAALAAFRLAGIPIRSAYLLAQTGQADDARQIIADVLARTERDAEAYHLATAFVGLGQLDEALRWLSVAVRQRAYDVVYMKVDPRLDPLRDRAGFAALLQEGGW